MGALAPTANAGKTFDLYTTNSPSGDPIHDIAPLNKPNDVNDIPLIGNWDGTGTDRFSLYHPTTRQFVLNKANRPDSASKAYVAGNWGDIPFLGRWNSALTKDVVALYRPENRIFYFPTTGNGALLDGAVQLSDNGYDVPITGDWNGDGIDTLGAFRPSTANAGTFYFKNSNTAAWDPQLTISGIGNPGDKPVVGDWNGNTVDTVGLFRPSNVTFYFVNESKVVGASAKTIGALSTDKPVIGDWNGDGIDTYGLFRAGGHAVYLAMSNVDLPSWVGDGYYLSNVAVEPNDKMLYADWDGNGTDSPGFYRPETREMFYSNSAQAPTRNSFGPIGDPGDIPLAGHWTNATNRDMPALYRPSNDTFYYPSGSTPAMNASYGLNATPGDIVLAADWNGDGIDTLGLYRTSNRTLYIRNVNENVTWQNAGTGGNPEDLPVTGHFRGTALETFALFRPGDGAFNRFYGANATANFDTYIPMGNPGDKPAVGDWDGDGTDTVGVYRVIVPQFGGADGFINNVADADEFIRAYRDAESDHVAATKLVAALWPQEIETVDSYFKDVSIPGGLFRAAGTPEVWWYMNGTRHHITSAAIADRLGVNLGNTWRVSTGARDRFSLGEAIDGTNATSWRFGGTNGIIDTLAEAQQVVSADRAESDDSGAVWDGIRTTEEQQRVASAADISSNVAEFAPEPEPGQATQAGVDVTSVMRGDEPHISATAPLAVSAHAWWATGRLFEYRAVVKVKLQQNRASEWVDITDWSVSKPLKPVKLTQRGAPSSRKNGVRANCTRYNHTYAWRSVIDVDIVGRYDWWSVKRIENSTITINCSAVGEGYGKGYTR